MSGHSQFSLIASLPTFALSTSLFVFCFLTFRILKEEQRGKIDTIIKYKGYKIIVVSIFGMYDIYLYIIF